MSELGSTIEAAAPGAVVGEHEGVDGATIEIARERVREVAAFLKGPPLAFAMLSDLTCADIPEEPGRFRLAYQLFSLETRTRVRLRVWAGAESPSVPSVTPVWATANWHEREVYDMFGIRFEDHPDLTRILMPLDWEGYPLRRDYPIGGEEVEFSDAR